MATLFEMKNGSRRIQFYAPSDGARKTLYLGKMPKRLVESIKANIEAIIACKAAGVALDADTAGWLSKISTDLRAKLVAVNLCDPAPESTTLKAFLDAYATNREADMKPGSLANMKHSFDAATNYFGSSRALQSLTEADGEDWLRHLASKGASEATRRTRTKDLKTALNYAVRRGLLPKNPLAKCKTAPIAAEKPYVAPATIEALLAACPDHRWRTMLGLCRFAGLRCPSETHILKWDDVDFKRRRLKVRSPKTEHHPGHEERMVPIEPRLFPLLEAARDTKGKDDQLVIKIPRNNLRRGLLNLLKKAGLKEWDKLFHALRASCETDWLEHTPEHVVAKVLGHSVAVSRRHYAQQHERMLDQMTELRKAA